jgi:hypothetical protein
VPREVEKLSHDARNPIDLCVDDARALDDLLSRYLAARDHLRMARDDTQGSSNLVGYSGGKHADGGETIGVSQLFDGSDASVGFGCSAVLCRGKATTHHVHFVTELTKLRRSAKTERGAEIPLSDASGLPDELVDGTAYEPSPYKHREKPEDGNDCAHREKRRSPRRACMLISFPKRFA